MKRLVLMCTALFAYYADGVCGGSICEELSKRTSFNKRHLPAYIDEKRPFIWDPVEDDAVPYLVFDHEVAAVVELRSWVLGWNTVYAVGYPEDSVTVPRIIWRLLERDSVKARLFNLYARDTSAGGRRFTIYYVPADTAPRVDTFRLHIEDGASRNAVLVPGRLFQLADMVNPAIYGYLADEDTAFAVYTEALRGWMKNSPAPEGVFIEALLDSTTRSYGNYRRAKSAGGPSFLEALVELVHCYQSILRWEEERIPSAWFVSGEH